MQNLLLSNSCHWFPPLLFLQFPVAEAGREEEEEEEEEEVEVEEEEEEEIEEEERAEPKEKS